MSINKYYDWQRGIHLDPEADGCPYNEWKDNPRKLSFTVHPDGFLIFLPLEEALRVDEYAHGDPYTVAENLTNSFHMDRIESTLGLIDTAVAKSDRLIKILDIGCGRGYITSLIKDHSSLVEVSGIDRSLSAIQFAAHNFRDIDFIVGDAYRPPYSKDYFDLIVCNNVWEHLPDPVALLAGIKKILRKKGHLVISTPSRYRLSNMVRVIMGKPIALQSRMHVTEYSVGQLCEQLRFESFETIKIFSKPTRIESYSVKNVVGYRVLLPLVKGLLRVIGSHHCVDDTIFLLARKV
jgi:SAM-dependent methyltransferase